MTITTTSSSAVDLSTFYHSYHTNTEEPTRVRQNYSPIVYNYHLGTFPLHHSPVVPIHIAEPECPALRDLVEMSAPSFPSYPNSQSAYTTMSILSFADGGPLYPIPYTDQPHLHYTDETTPDGLLAPGPSEFPYSSAPPTTLRPPGLPELTHISTSASDQTQIQAVVYPPSTSITLHGFGGNDTAHAVPLAAAAASPAMDLSNTVYTCQCVTDGSLCRAEVGGTIRSVRDHLKRAHAFRSVGKNAIKCLWVGCENTLQQENIPRHIVSRHLQVKVSCVECGLPLSRRDVQYSHAKACRARRQTAFELDSDVSSTPSTR